MIKTKTTATRGQSENKWLFSITKWNWIWKSGCYANLLRKYADWRLTNKLNNIVFILEWENFVISFFFFFFLLDVDVFYYWDCVRIYHMYYKYLLIVFVCLYYYYYCRMRCMWVSLKLFSRTNRIVFFASSSYSFSTI